MLFLLVALSGAVLATAVAAQIPLATVAPDRNAEAADVPGPTVDPNGHAIYAMNPDGGIDAISPTSGELLWRTGEAARPLAILGDQLIAQAQPASAGVLDVVFLDTRDGTYRRTLSTALPEGIVAAIDQGMSTNFTARAEILDDEPYLLWDHTRRYAKGIAPAPGEELEQKIAGASRLDLTTGRTFAVDPTTLELTPALPPAVQQWVDSGELSTPPAAAGEVLAATRVAGDRITLKRWRRSGEPLPDVELHSGPYLIELRSANRRHLVIGERVAPGEWDEYGWSIFSLETGQRLGQVRNRFSHAWYIVRDGTLIYVALPGGRRVDGKRVVEPLTLRAVLLAGGATVWERPLRDTSYRGPFPP